MAERTEERHGFWRDTWRNLRRRPIRTVLSILGIALAVGGVYIVTFPVSGSTFPIFPFAPN